MSKIQYPHPQHSPFTDANGQIWEWNGMAWVRRGLGAGIEDVDADSQQYSRSRKATKLNPDYPGQDPDTGKEYPQWIEYPGEWVLTTADQWYLGAFPENPSGDNFGGGLIPGHTYYNTQTKTVYVWDGGEWDAFSGVSEIATLSEFRWDSLDVPAEGTLDVNEGDENGNYPVDAWIEGMIILSIYKNGIRLIEQRSTDGTYKDLWDPNSGVFPGANTANLWDWWTVSVEGSLDGVDFKVGDVLQAISQNASAVSYQNNWHKLPIEQDDGAGGIEPGPGAGFGLDKYDYTVEYSDGSEGTGQRVTFLEAITSGQRLVIETGTLAASEYVKTTFENACGWNWVNCGVMDPEDTTKLPVQKTVADYVKLAIEQSGLGYDNHIGTVFDFAGNQDTVPDGALVCTGEEMLISQYPKLHAKIGSKWNNFNGVTTRADMFRLPPQTVDVNGTDQPLYFAGSNDESGSYRSSQNKAHKHTNDHTHVASTSTAGNHSHDIRWVNASGNLPVAHHMAWHNRWYGQWKGDRISEAGAHKHTVNISGNTQTTGSNGGTVSRPPTALILKCIWGDKPTDILIGDDFIDEEA